MKAFAGSSVKYRPINGWTKAKIIETIRNRPDVACIESENNAVYFDNKGNSCAVGVFIDEKYRSRALNEVGVTELFRTFPEVARLLPLEMRGMTELQVIHDDMMLLHIEGINQALIQWVLINVEES